MSAFDAGSIRGSLNLETSEYVKNLNSATQLTKSEGEQIDATLKEIAAAFEQEAGRAAAEFAKQTKAAMEAAAADAKKAAEHMKEFWLGAFAITSAAVIGLAEGIKKATVDTAHEIRQLSLEADKAGVSFDFLERLTNVGGVYGIGLDQITNSFKILEQQVEGATDGSNKKAAEGFAALGISIQQAGELAKDPEQLIGRMRVGLDKLTEAAHRTAVMHDVLGRSGYTIIPIMKLSQEEFNKTADTLGRLKGSVDQSTIAAADDFAMLQAEVSAALDGIAREAAKPVLKALSDHFHQSSDQIEKDANKAKKAVDDLMFGLEVVIGLVEKPLGKTYEWLSKIGDALANILEKLGLIQAMAQLGNGKDFGPNWVTKYDTPEQAYGELKKEVSLVDNAKPHARSAESSAPSSDSPPATQPTPQPPHRVPYSLISGELTDAVKGADGLYHARSAHGHGMSASLTEEEYRNLRNAEKENREGSAKSLERNNQDSVTHSTAAHAGSSVPFSEISTELTDAVKAADGLYHVRSVLGRGMGGALTQEQYDNLRAAERSHRPSTANMTAPGQSGVNNRSNGEDSITAWRRTHDQQPDSITQSRNSRGTLAGDSLNTAFAQIHASLADHDHSRGSAASGSAAAKPATPSPTTYNIQVSVTANLDKEKTAAAIAAKIMPELNKAQKNHDQQLAGRVAAAGVAASLGGGN